MTQAQIPCSPEDRDEFKIIAASEKVSMTALIHTWIERYKKEKNDG